MIHDSRSVGIAIPAYRDPVRLRRALASIRALDAGWLSAVTVVDDSGDGRVATEVAPEFPPVMFIVHAENLGFAKAATRALLENSCEFVILLNDDAELIADPRKDIVSAFDEQGLFALGLKSVDAQGKMREGAKRLVWRLGIAKILHNEQDQLSSAGMLQPTSYAVGGHAVYRKDAFKALGGFDHVFAPFYWEDADLCLRAKTRNFATKFLPRACVRHGLDGAIRSSHTAKDIRLITLRNRLLFSLRHALGFQRLLQPVGLLLYKITFVLNMDRAANAAITEARRLYRSSLDNIRILTAEENG